MSSAKVAWPLASNIGKGKAARNTLAMVGLALAASGACHADSFLAPGPGDYRVADLTPAQIDFVRLGLTNCTSALALSTTRVLAACRSNQDDKRNDVGLRVYLLAVDNQRPRILSASKGLGDAYRVKLQQRSNTAVPYQDLVLADASAEYAYGVAVYQLRNDSLRYIGEIDYVLMNSDGNPISALDAIKIHGISDGFKVTFTQNVFALDKNGEYRQLDASKTFSMFDGKTLRQFR